MLNILVKFQWVTVNAGAKMQVWWVNHAFCDNPVAKVVTFCTRRLCLVSDDVLTIN